MATAVDIENLPGDEAGRVMGEECAGGADVANVDNGAGRGLGLCEQRVEFGEARGGSGGERPGRDRVDADALGSESAARWQT